jgi:hypothetical protein
METKRPPALPSLAFLSAARTAPGIVFGAVVAALLICAVLAVNANNDDAAICDKFSRAMETKTKRMALATPAQSVQLHRDVITLVANMPPNIQCGGVTFTTQEIKREIDLLNASMNARICDNFDLAWHEKTESLAKPTKAQLAPLYLDLVANLPPNIQCHGLTPEEMKQRIEANFLR